METVSLTTSESDSCTRVVATTIVEEHSYIYAGGRLLRESITTTRGSEAPTTQILDFIYDESGRPFALKYSTNGTSFTTYYYVLNLQGDVVGLINSSGSYVAKYTYDAWGNLLSVTSASGTAITSSTHIANRNPLRYRGYYYDSETGFYYLQSRYYDPATRRFINADGYASTGQGFLGYNMFAYCLSNPVIRTDLGGMASQHYAVILKNEGPVYNINNPSEYSIELKQQVEQILSQNCYSETYWDLLDEQERKAALNRLAGEVSSVLGITKHNLVYVADSPYHGTGTRALHADDEILIFVTKQERFDHTIIATVVHELYHAYQNDVIVGAINHNEPGDVVLGWAINKNNYYADAHLDYNRYYNQFMEVSARWFAGQLNDAYYNGKWGGYYGK